MIKLTFCLVRLPSLSREEFQQYWRTHHAPKVQAARDGLAIRRYVQNHTLDSGVAIAAAEGRGMPVGENINDFDGVAELWWDSENALAAAMATEEGMKQGAILYEDESKFIDFSRSRMFLTEENEVISG